MFKYLSWAGQGFVRTYGLPFHTDTKGKTYMRGSPTRPAMSQPLLGGFFIDSLINNPYGSVPLDRRIPVYQNGRSGKRSRMADGSLSIAERRAILHPQDLPDQHTFTYFHKVFPMYDSKSILDDVFYYTT